MDWRKEWKLIDYLNIFYGFQFFLLVGIKWASGVWKSLEKSIREKMEKVFGGAVLIVYRPLVRSRLLTAKGDTERRSPRRSEPWRWTESLPKQPVECKEKAELSFFALRPGPLRPADPTSCRRSYVFTCSSSFISWNINFKRKKKNWDWSNKSATTETWNLSQQLHCRLLFFFEKPPLPVVAQH